MLVTLDELETSFILLFPSVFQLLPLNYETDSAAALGGPTDELMLLASLWWSETGPMVTHTVLGSYGMFPNGFMVQSSVEVHQWTRGRVWPS